MPGRDRHVDGSEPYGDEDASQEELTGEGPPLVCGHCMATFDRTDAGEEAFEAHDCEPEDRR